MRKSIILAVLSVTLLSCNRSYQEPPFGGMKGRVEKVTEYHKMAEVWFAGRTGTDVMYMNASVYDINGHEIASAVMDSIGRIQAEAESVFENNVCIRSTQRSGGRTIVQINFMERKGHDILYDKILGNSIINMVVNESSFLRRYKSLVSENGQATSSSTIRVNRKGMPVKVDIFDLKAGTSSHEKNKYDRKNNLIEKHIVRKDASGKETQEVVYTKYARFDDHGNWTEARTFNKNRLPVEVINREIVYWQ